MPVFCRSDRKVERADATPVLREVAPQVNSKGETLDWVRRGRRTAFQTI
jgi:hypothetical protein